MVETFYPVQGKEKNLSEIHMLLNMHNHNSYPHVYVKCEENKITTAKVHQYNLINGLLYPSRRIKMDPTQNFVGMLRHRPRRFTENMEEGIQLPSFLINLHCPLVGNL